MKIGIAGLPELTSNYREALQSAGALCEVSLSFEKALGWDALVLPGGGDIDAALLPGIAGTDVLNASEAPPAAASRQSAYRCGAAPTQHPLQDPHCTDIDPELDRRQLALLDHFAAHKKPVLGICKGMQLIGLYFGSSFCQHLPTADAHRYIQYDQLHASHASNGSVLEKLYGASFVINSAHHQGVLPEKGIPVLGMPLCVHVSVIQLASDSVIEGIAHDALPILGLQWHPERLCGKHARADTIDGSRIFVHFLSQL